MVKGTVRKRGQDGSIVFWEPQIDVEVAGINLDFKTALAVVDTAFTGALALPREIIQELGLTQQGQRTARLAYGQRDIRIFGAVVSWFGQLRAVPVHETDDKPLVGNMLLDNCRLTIDFVEGGEVAIQPLQQTGPA